MLSKCTIRFSVGLLIIVSGAAPDEHAVCVQVSIDLLQVTKMKSWHTVFLQKDSNAYHIFASVFDPAEIIVAFTLFCYCCLFFTCFCFFFSNQGTSVLHR